MDLKGKVAIVTGASRGIGRATAVALAKHGARVVLAAREKGKLNEAAKEVNGLAVVTDVTKSADVKNMVKRTLKEFGTIDILVNNAGVAYNGYLWETTEEQWNEMVGVNLTGMYHCIHECVPHMKGGVIVNLSSQAGKIPIGGMSAYSATKWGVMGLSRALAQELDEIKVYTICPGPVDTDMFLNMTGRHTRMKPEEVAQIIVDTIERDKPSGSVIDATRLF